MTQGNQVECMPLSIRVAIDGTESPATWVRQAIEAANRSSTGVIEWQLVGATIERRFKDRGILDSTTGTIVRQGASENYATARIVYRVTTNPTSKELLQCATDIEAGKQPLLLVPEEQVQRAKILAQEQGIASSVFVLSIEDLIVFDVIQFAADESKEPLTLFGDIIEICSRRLAEAGTGLSLRVETR